MGHSSIYMALFRALCDFRCDCLSQHPSLICQGGGLFSGYWISLYLVTQTSYKKAGYQVGIGAHPFHALRPHLRLFYLDSHFA